jgi:hypothetical protein
VPKPKQTSCNDYQFQLNSFHKIIEIEIQRNLDSSFSSGVLKMNDGYRKMTACLSTGDAQASPVERQAFGFSAE